MWPNRMVLWLNIVDMLHSLEPILIRTRDSGLKIPCFTQFIGGEAFHLGSIAVATCMSVEIYRSIRSTTRAHPKYQPLYLAMSFGYPITGAISILLAGEVWSCEPGDMFECPHQYVTPDASYYGCFIDSYWSMLRNVAFIWPAALLSLTCVYCFVGSLLRIRQALASHAKLRASRRLLVITGTTILLLIVPWTYMLTQNVLQHVQPPWWLILYHSFGNGWNGAANVILVWWRLDVVSDIYRKVKERRGNNAVKPGSGSIGSVGSMGSMGSIGSEGGAPIRRQDTGSSAKSQASDLPVEFVWEMESFDVTV
ncbi:hypothetical protein KIPB_002156 [Kipferlia bialata]|uniref:G-protein coupled receptors family 1 profile domain-containing protein n=1 Tax=Kipferlia bialata TaxID=797122 RepID=A0A9K3CRT5_9EUKA|nr:hypothetical protein KIPB_002156 [Kipferlia bialata]|eukprot:g2156.t1